MPRVETPRRAVVVRRRRVGVTEVSRTGCRLEGNDRLAPGEIGMLTVDIGGERHVEMFRVTRAVRVAAGDHQYEAGLEFLPLPAEAASLQDIVVKFERADNAT